MHSVQSLWTLWTTAHSSKRWEMEESPALLGPDDRSANRQLSKQIAETEGCTKSMQLRSLSLKKRRTIYIGSLAACRCVDISVG